MAILHGSWLIHRQDHTLPLHQRSRHDGSQRTHLLSGHFFIWGETWRRVEPNDWVLSGSTLPHPFVMDAEELAKFLRSLHQDHNLGGFEEIPLDPQAKPYCSHWHTVTAAFPTYRIPIAKRKAQIAAVPQHSASTTVDEVVPGESAAAGDLSLHAWTISGLCLSPSEAIQLLHSLPLGSVDINESRFSPELRFWSHVARWMLDLLSRSKFLPILARRADNTRFTRWQALLDSGTDQMRLRHFISHMPAACQMYGENGSNIHSLEQLETSNPVADDVSSDADTLASDATNGSPVDTPSDSISTPSNNGAEPKDAAGVSSFADQIAHQIVDDEQRFQHAKDLLFSFLNNTIDAQVRSVASTVPMPATQLPKDLPLREWLQSLGNHPILAAEPERGDRLEGALTTWLTPIERQLTQQIARFRTGFHLHPPEAGGTNWTLEYCLQANDDPNFLVSAETIWSNPVERLVYAGRTIQQPQETLLAGLGLATRLYPLIEPSLQDQQPRSCLLTPTQVYEFIKSVAWLLQDSGFGVILPPSLSNPNGLASRLGLSVRAEPPRRGKRQQLGLQSLLNFKWELTIGGQRLSKTEFDRLVAMNTPLVDINGEWVELRSQDIKAAQSFFAARKDQMTLSLEDALRISTGDTQTIEKLPVVDFEASGTLEELIQTLTTGNESIETIGVPDSFQGELRPYQLRGVSWLAFLERWGLGACLADDMGLGKTIQLIALLLHLQEHDNLEHPTLLVCPTSVLGNWEREVKRFGPSLKVVVHHGDKRSQGKAFAKAVNDKDLVVTSYALAYRDIKDLRSVSWQGIVLDEAQNIKNPDAKQSQAVRELDAQFRIALTGTPIENRLSELWSILDFLNPGYLGPRNFFQRRFAVPIERYGDTDSLQTLRSLVQPFILRRLKTDRDIIRDLPDKQEMTVFCGLSADQAALYQKLVDQSLAAIESAEGIQRRGMILALLVKLKQICNHPALMDDASGEVPKKSRKRSAAIDPASNPSTFKLASGKLQRLEEMLEEVISEGDRALVFTQFAEWGKLLKAYLERQFEREVLFLYGSTSKKQREDMVDRFQSDPQGPRIFILSLKAGGVGLNLTRANHVFHFDRWWNPAVENQATDRVFRIGQTRNVQVHKFVCTGTLEERIHELIESKKALSEQVVGTGENWLTDFDTDQLRNLLLLDRSAVIGNDDSE
ncbi:MAG: DEAD/DEAH box helicase [Elainellaceae cyanobacterium]